MYTKTLIVIGIYQILDLATYSLHECLRITIINITIIIVGGILFGHNTRLSLTHPSDGVSVCPLCGPYSETKRHRKTKIVVNIPVFLGKSNQCVSLMLKGLALCRWLQLSLNDVYVQAGLGWTTARHLCGDVDKRAVGRTVCNFASVTAKPRACQQ